MSHFSVIVIGENIDEQLAPYQEGLEIEFESTEKEYRHKYETEQTEVVILENGSWRWPHDNMFLKNNDVLSNEYEYPETSTIQKKYFKDLYVSFEEFMQEYCGEEDRNEEFNEYGYWHNPQSKWDWYSVGGRFMGYFKLLPNTTGELGVSGAFDNKPKEGYVDSIRLCDIDVAGMQDYEVKQANETYDKIEEILKGREFPSWNTILEKHGEDVTSARNEYNSLQVVKDFNLAKFYFWGEFYETFSNSREAYIKKCKNQTMVPFAIVKDGKWYQKGKMGWFGMSSEEMTEDDWNKQFWEMINNLPPETKLTIVDCHI